MVFSGTVYAAELDDKGDGKARSQAVSGQAVWALFIFRKHQEEA